MIVAGAIKTTYLAGIYIHIPFCKQACNYCNFHFSTNLSRKTDLIKAIAKEISKPEAFIPKQPIETIYFGGGTPGLLSDDELQLLFVALRDRFSIASEAEVTLEANPDDISHEKLYAWQKLGINRLSLGIQSFDDSLLQKMNRAHDAAKAKDSLLQIRAAGFSNFSADLIYGSAGQTPKGLESDLNVMFDADVPHLSCYALTVEPKTALAHDIVKGNTTAPDPDIQASLYDLLIDRTRAAGYEAYEISNLAKPGFRSKHNSNYWTGVPYYGFGPSAHAFDGKSIRRKNVANNSLYLTGIEKGIDYFEEEHLTDNDRFNEFVMVSLRRIEGLDLQKLQSDFPEQLSRIQHELNHLEQEGLIKLSETNALLTEKGRYLADGIASDLFVLD